MGFDPRTAPPPDEVIGQAELGGITLPLYRSYGYTARDIEKMPDSIKLSIFKALAPRAPAGVDLGKATVVLLGAVQIEWYRASGKEPPQTVLDNHAKRVEQASRSPEAPAQPGEYVAPAKKRLVKDVIIDGLLTGIADEKIIENVREAFPESGSGKKDIAYYRFVLRKEGRLEKKAKKQKAAAASAETTGYVPSGSEKTSK